MEAAATQRPATLSRRASEAIQDIEALLRAAIDKRRAASATPGRGAAIVSAPAGRIE
jgi:hypothetical protein